MDILSQILERKHREIARRLRRADTWSAWSTEGSAQGRGGASTVATDGAATNLGQRACAALRRDGEKPRAIAELKFRSPSAGSIRARHAGAPAEIAKAYADAGAAAISVLGDRPGFGGTPLDVRRVASAVRVPVLFKEFVLNQVQVDLARSMGASMVLLLVRALEEPALHRLVDACLARDLAPVVEAADARELDIALQTRATIIGINARDLRTFKVDSEAALRCIEAIPRHRIAVYMSGVSRHEDVIRVSRSRADAMLIGEGLMRAPSPGAKLRELLG